MNDASRRWIATPLGDMTALATCEALVRLEFGAPCESQDATEGGNPILEQTVRELGEYFAGERTEFGVPVAPTGTAFQQRVWGELVKIPCAQTISYRALAERVGDAHAVRAVGGANGANPIAIIIPCHRVIASDGTLGGYAGGLDRKRALLDLEQRAMGVEPVDADGNLMLA